MKTIILFLMMTGSALAQNTTWDLSGTIVAEAGVVPAWGVVGSEFDIQYNSPNAEYEASYALGYDPFSGPFLAIITFQPMNATMSFASPNDLGVPPSLGVIVLSNVHSGQVVLGGSTVPSVTRAPELDAAQWPVQITALAMALAILVSRRRAR